MTGIWFSGLAGRFGADKSKSSGGFYYTNVGSVTVPLWVGKISEDNYERVFVSGTDGLQGSCVGRTYIARTDM
jgi:hypothetical protein